MSSLYDYSDVYILEKRKMTITGEKDDVATRQRHKRDKKILFKNCALLTDCISKR